MKVVFFSRKIYGSGVTTVLIELMSQLIELEVDVFLVHGGFESDDPVLVDRIRSFGARVSQIEMPRSKNKVVYLFEYFKFTLLLKRYLRSYSPDVIHLHSAVLGLAFKLNRIDVIQTIHQSKMRLGIFRIIPQLEIAVSEDILRESRGNYGVPRANSICINNPVNFNRFSARNELSVDEVKMKFDLANFNFVISSVANIEYRKGHDVLINAVNRLVGIDGSIQPIILFVGRILDHDYFAKVVSLSRVKVVHIGFCNPESLFWASDVHVLASRRESFPVSIIESMAAGVCTVRSKSEGAVDQISDGITGFLFENEDDHELCRILNNLFTNRPLRSKVASNGANFVRDNFDIRIIAEKTLNEYKKFQYRKMK